MDGTCTIHRAASAGEVDKVKRLLQQDPQLMNILCAERGFGAIHWYVSESVSD